MSDDKPKKPAATARPPGASRLYVLAAGGALALLGVLGFFYDAGFGAGNELADDDLAGILVVNGWRNVVYLATGLLALGFAARAPRASAFALGAFYLVFAIWGFEVTERGIGSILDTLPLGDNDNALHLALGALGVGAGLADGGLPSGVRSLPQRLKPRRRKARKTRGQPKRGERKHALGESKPAKTERGDRRRSPTGPRRGADA